MFSFNCSVCRREGQGRALVDAVTLETLKVPDRDAEKELVDAVNDASPELLRDVVRCFRSKLEQPDPHVQLLALQALDACFKGCGKAFHDMMATKDLLDVVVRIVVTETLQYEDEVRDMARALVQSWARGTRLLAFQEALAELAAEDEPGEDAAAFGGGRDARPAGPSSAGRGGALKSADRAGLGQGLAARRAAPSSSADEREGLLDEAHTVDLDDLLRPRAGRGGGARAGPPPPRGADTVNAAVRGLPKKQATPAAPPPSPAQSPAQSPAPKPPPAASGSGPLPRNVGAAAAAALAAAPKQPPAPPPAVPAAPPLPFQSADAEEAAMLQEMLASNLKEEAESLYNGGHYEAAEKVFTQAILYAPTERALFCGRSQCLAAQGRLDEALADARAVVEMAPGWHVGHGLEAGVLAEMGQHEEALDAFQVAAQFAEADEEEAAEEFEEYTAAAQQLQEVLAETKRRARAPAAKPAVKAAAPAPVAAKAAAPAGKAPAPPQPQSRAGLPRAAPPQQPQQPQRAALPRR